MLWAVAERAVVMSKVIITPAPVVYRVRAVELTVWADAVVARMFPAATSRSIRMSMLSAEACVKPSVSMYFLSGLVGSMRPVDQAPVEARVCAAPPGMFVYVPATGRPPAPKSGGGGCG